MKKLIIILLQLNLFLFLYAQEKIPWEHEIPWGDEESGEQQTDVPSKEKAPFTFARQYIELGVDFGTGFDNDLVVINDLLKKNVYFNVNKLGKEAGADGFNFNLGLLGGLFLNVMNIKIAGGTWNVGVDSEADGNVHFNIPESLIELFWKGNYRRLSKGMVSASGGIFADVGLNLSAKYDKLRIGFRPGVYTPLVFVPKSGINYSLETTDEKIELKTSGDLVIYSPIIDSVNDRGMDLAWGSDFTLEGEYDLFTYLGLGLSISNIPLAPAEMEKRTRIAMKDFNLIIEGEKLINSKDGEKIDIPKFEYSTEYDIASRKVFRPLRFDIYALYRPFGDILLLKPDIGITVNINDSQGLFSMGVEGQVTLFKNLLAVNLYTGYDETLWKFRLGFGLNFRAFELDLEGVLRSQSFTGSLMGHGYGVNMGIRFGW